MHKKKFNLKALSGNVLLVCGLVAALCTAWTQVKDTFFPKEEVAVVTPAPSPNVTVNKTIYIALPDGANLMDALRDAQRPTKGVPPLLKAPEPAPAATQSIQTTSANVVKKSYIWIAILVLSLGAIYVGHVLRNHKHKEV